MMTGRNPAKQQEAMRPGQDLVIAGYIGIGGMRTILEHKERELLTRFSQGFIDGCRAVCEAEPAAEEVLCREVLATVYEAAGDGGIMAALWHLFEACGLGFEIELRALPLRQETIELCEVFDINPYRLQSDGCAVAAADNGRDLVRCLEQKGIHGVVIGKVEAGIKRQIINGDIRTFLDRPKPDELYKIN